VKRRNFIALLAGSAVLRVGFEVVASADKRRDGAAEQRVRRID
jgi:hypothetical protein